MMERTLVQSTTGMVFFWLKAIQLGISYILFMMMLGLKIDILNEKSELMVPGEGGGGPLVVWWYS